MERFSSDRGHQVVVAAPLVDHGLDVVLNLRSISTTHCYSNCSKKLDRFRYNIDNPQKQQALVKCRVIEL